MTRKWLVVTGYYSVASREWDPRAPNDIFWEETA